MIVLPGLLCGPLVTGKITEAARRAAGDHLAVVQEIGRHRVCAGRVGADRGADFVGDLGVADQIVDRRRRIDRLADRVGAGAGRLQSSSSMSTLRRSAPSPVVADVAVRRA
ncbi:MAG: hypothetical protein IPI34_14910 [bacterium]|nr:hypothetical protein [bacterium]